MKSLKIDEICQETFRQISVFILFVREAKNVTQRAYRRNFVKNLSAGKHVTYAGANQRPKIFERHRCFQYLL